MVIKNLSFTEYRELGKSKGVSIIGDKVYKICPDSMAEVLRVTECFKDDVMPNIVLPDEYLEFGGILVGYTMPYLSEYKPVGEKLIKREDFDRLKVIYKTLEVMFKMLDSGINYVDMHVFNVLVNGDDTKVIDISDVSLDEDKGQVAYGIVDFVFNTLYGDGIYFFRLKNLMLDDRFSRYFSTEFKNFVLSIYDFDKTIDPKDVYKYMDELKDDKKNETVRKLVYELYEEGIFKNRV